MQTAATTPECDCPFVNTFHRGLPCRIDDEVPWRADGSSFPAEYSSYPVIEHGAVATFEGITERQRIAREIHDALGSLLVALEWQAQKFIDSSELEATLTVHVPASVPAPAGGLEIAVFSIFQALPSNVARHAQARSVRAQIAVDDPPGPVLTIDVCDDGVRAAPEVFADPHSLSVMWMRKRASHFGGRLVIASAPGQGTRARPGHARAA